jgi:hypothetical protein
VVFVPRSGFRVLLYTCTAVPRSEPSPLPD